MQPVYALIRCAINETDCFESDLRLPYSGFLQYQEFFKNAGSDLPGTLISGVQCELL